MSRSNAPLALSVVNLTVPDDIDATFKNITRFDDADFGFNHNQTWNAMPAALRGELRPNPVAGSFKKTNIRVQRCITALCAEGIHAPRNTLKFSDFPESGMRSVQLIDWDPKVQVRVKATCWYVEKSQVFIPLLQPRKESMTLEQLGAYVRLGRQAYCQGGWVDAQAIVVDLSGDDPSPIVKIIREDELPLVTDAALARLVKTFVEAKALADKYRAEKPKKPSKTPMDNLLGLE